LPKEPTPQLVAATKTLPSPLLETNTPPTPAANPSVLSTHHACVMLGDAAAVLESTHTSESLTENTPVMFWKGNETTTKPPMHDEGPENVTILDESSTVCHKSLVEVARVKFATAAAREEP
jgi:hypothetical protein